MWNYLPLVQVFLGALAFIVPPAATTGGLNGLPVLNGPIPIVPQGDPDMKSGPGQFVHPGLWHTHDDLERIRVGVEQGKEPYASAFKNFSASEFSTADYEMRGPQKILCRGGCNNYTTFTSDVRGAYQNALMWYITRDQGHWDKAASILDAWGTNLTDIIGVDTSLLVGLEGDLFVNAAEIMRWEGGWVESRERNGWSINIGQANYGMASIKALLSFAVYLDDVALYNYALHAWKNDPCGGVYGNFQMRTGQGAEIGRDQGHAKDALAWAAQAARVIQSQGRDVYGYGDDLLLKASEYAAKYNLGYDVEYDRNFYRCEAILVNGPWAQPSNISRGITAGAFDIIYYQYVVKKGKKAEYTTRMKKAIDAVGGEGSGGTDFPGWGDLIWSYHGQGRFYNDNHRTIWGGGKLGPEGVGNINVRT
uniref:Alginate lyase domain-containing protein n=1 Tax=Bionectria ochroleuca TaxID=29856 RepID=A0A8H7K7Z7_BIOOC